MAYDIQIPIDDLLDCGSHLHTVADEFQNAQDISSAYNDAVGHPGLRGKLDSMASNWKDHRNDMMGNVQALGQTATAAGQTFSQVEEQLTKSISNLDGDFKKVSATKGGK